MTNWMSVVIHIDMVILCLSTKFLLAIKNERIKITTALAAKYNHR